MRFFQAAGNRLSQAAPHPSEYQFGDAFYANKFAWIGGSFFCELEQCTVSQDFKGRTIDLPCTGVTRQIELAKDGQGFRVEQLRAFAMTPQCQLPPLRTFAQLDSVLWAC